MAYLLAGEARRKSQGDGYVNDKTDHEGHVN